MTPEQAERERREESLSRCRETEKAIKARMRDEEPHVWLFGDVAERVGRETVVALMNSEQQEVEGYPV